METILTIVILSMALLAIHYKRQLFLEQRRSDDLAQRLGSYRKAYFDVFDEEEEDDETAEGRDEDEIACPCDGCCCLGENDCEFSSESGVKSPS